MRDLFIEIAFNLSLIGEFYLFIFGSDSSGFFSFFFGYSIVKFTFYNNVSTCFFFLVDFCLGFMGAILKLKIQRILWWDDGFFHSIFCAIFD
jgi:hypothetical protein